MCSNANTHRRDLGISTVRMKSEEIVDIARAVECPCRKPTLDYDTRTSSRLAVIFGSGIKSQLLATSSLLRT